MRNNRSVTSAEPRGLNLPFDESKYDRFVEGGVVVYKPKKPFAHNLPSQTLSPHLNTHSANLSTNPPHANLHGSPSHGDPHMNILHSNPHLHPQHLPAPNLILNYSNFRSLPIQQRPKSLSVHSGSKFNQMSPSFPQRRGQP